MGIVLCGKDLWLNSPPRLAPWFSKTRQVWTAGVAVTGVADAAMLDTGNFMLANRDFVNLWESFSEPTDTLLPTQTLAQGLRLVARYSEANYSSGRFQLVLQSDGNLVLYTRAFPLE
ncbi:hypothetical protein TIFTF001_001346 [Ficus carica]|uniref:Bulb-type lectin domain-containing protein n=1 Tax=Ficus carica TaxID=3494 RepID=A0AA87YZG3_FICCA|nr:hypothetical protein TIFTF001_001346 [Ficus carica]